MQATFKPDYNLEPHVQKMIDSGLSGLDIIHGELKNLMYQAERNIEAAENWEPLAEGEHYESDDYYTGYLDALATVYELTYQLSFAITERESND
jgi:hypothetical protein